MYYMYHSCNLIHTYANPPIAHKDLLTLRTPPLLLDDKKKIRPLFWITLSLSLLLLLRNHLFDHEQLYHVNGRTENQENQDGS